MGLRFGLGHVGVLFFLGCVALAWGVTIPSAWQSTTEMFGGSLLVLLGLWTFLEWLREAGYAHAHPHRHRTRRADHTHFHIHLKDRHPHRHLHPHFSTVLGGLFALSGLRSLLLSAVPILQSRSTLWVAVYILLFGIGIVASMTAYGWISGSVLSSGLPRKWLTLILGFLSVGVGLYWISIS